ncbi:hypothetical protein N7474_005216 [Penicillium riverlandense]|uniref:uncharacterized protein n=1 Tax=Penicillium riverlandense TaxID=1903569 RepID=UPI002547C3D8|nr:uncharacterized protein N7474_005216 [Penicillium riverlandense]KAJ5819625.1 hypothetical protein N7474_005216 [Penicillium riverlandense]
MAHSYPYPPIPADCVDRQGTLPVSSSHSPRELILVSETTSDEWGAKEEAAARALQEGSVALSNARLHRTHNRSLAPCPFAYKTTETTGKNLGGEYQSSGCRKDPLHRRVHPRRFLNESDLKLLRRFFPSAKGVRVLISGFRIVLFQNRKDIEASWLEGCVPLFGFLRLGYDVAVHYPTTTVVESGNAVADSPQKGEPVTPLGLRLKLSDGSIAHKDAGRIIRMKSVLCKSTWMKVKDAMKMKSTENSPLGKIVWFAEEPKEKIGNVTTSYDHHISRSPTFAQTIEHDTSIVPGERLPKSVESESPTGTEGCRLG